MNTYNQGSEKKRLNSMRVIESLFNKHLPEVIGKDFKLYTTSTPENWVEIKVSIIPLSVKLNTAIPFEASVWILSEEDPREEFYGAAPFIFSDLKDYIKNNKEV